MKHSEIRKKIRLDFYRLEGKNFTFLKYIKCFLFMHSFRIIVFYRRSQSSFSLVRFFNRKLLHLYGRKFGIDISHKAKIGNGFVLAHGYNITISGRTVIGDNVTILKGATLGMMNSGGKVGSPIIGNNVYIGVNVSIIGKVRIGNDVIFAPNSFCNIDVPEHSIVIGNPCKIIKKENATNKYIFNRV